MARTPYQDDVAEQNFSDAEKLARQYILDSNTSEVGYGKVHSQGMSETKRQSDLENMLNEIDSLKKKD